MAKKARVGTAVLIALAALGALADVIASDLPLACRVDGRSHFLPCLLRPAALAADDNQSLRARAEWMIAPPIPYSPLAQHPGGVTEVLSPPSGAHWLGTDDRGRGVAARLVHGTRVALAVGPLAVLLYLVVGAAVGVAAALGRRLDLVLSRLIEIGLTFPTLFLLLAIQGFSSRASLVEVGLAIALTQWPQVARLTRAEALRVAASPHVEAARALGATPVTVAARHILPLAFGPALVAAAFGIAQAVLFETALSFLGFGVPPPTATWGELLAQAQASGLRLHLLLPPTAAVALTVVACNLVGDAVRARLEPGE
jgi:peptide/nickel transport system permease protein